MPPCVIIQLYHLTSLHPPPPPSLFILHAMTNKTKRYTKKESSHDVRTHCSSNHITRLRIFTSALHVWYNNRDVRTTIYTTFRLERGK